MCTKQNKKQNKKQSCKCNFFLFSGDEFIVKQKTSNFIEKLGIESNNIFTYNALDSKIENILSSFLTSSFYDNKKIIIIEGFPKTKISDRIYKLKDVISNNVYILFVIYDNFSDLSKYKKLSSEDKNFKKNELYKFIKSNGAIKDFESDYPTEFKPWEVDKQKKYFNYILDIVKKYNIDISEIKNFCDIIYSRLGINYRRVDIEIKKISELKNNNKITIDDIDKIITNDEMFDSSKLEEYIASRNSKKALEIVNLFLSSKTESTSISVILLPIIRTIRNLLIIKLYKTENRNIPFNKMNEEIVKELDESYLEEYNNYKLYIDEQNEKRMTLGLEKLKYPMYPKSFGKPGRVYFFEKNWNSFSVIDLYLFLKLSYRIILQERNYGYGKNVKYCPNINEIIQCFILYICGDLSKYTKGFPYLLEDN